MNAKAVLLFPGLDRQHPSSWPRPEQRAHHDFARHVSESAWKKGCYAMKNVHRSTQLVGAGKQRIRIRLSAAVVKELRRRIGQGRFAVANYFKDLLRRKF
jgi:hypothetical protein